MEKITKDILGFLGNKHTKVELKEEFKGNYYSYITDTIYIAKNFTNGRNNAKVNTKSTELVTVCHECVHSVQSKWLHVLNTAFSNLSIILTIIYVLLEIFCPNVLWLKIATCIVIIMSMIIRLTLEIGAISGSIQLATDVVSKNIVQDVSTQDIQDGAQYISKYKYLAILQMIADKIIYLILIMIVK